ncbi:LLM class F420-dependent oxidoreductase [Ilumatobacter coccineus]|uniref:Putative oxidoreductase n=1 Tax=Ilumatobacter coccineus (strain NBRC 103263 / KCTC 29153 / YM16-304) TaxID=1313172 RepID=A0A6C7EG66_ILUCY|nr:LLM class F420-dependent oxidoreductase [Ilumatobacter coccineus]BAN02986.1 putative oxidoreductase [Ilumatobacter coccineus YM16-304]
MTTTARIGITLMAGDHGISPVELATAVEERGFESLWLPEHSHIPTSRQTPWPGSLTGEPLPEVYSRLYDLTVSLSMAAAVTSRIRLGTSVLLLAARDPLWTAKEFATLDALSGGRVEFGVGFGWNREEFENHGTDFPSRWDRTHETVEAIRSIWRDDVAEFHGDHVDIAPSWAWPKPAQPTGPRVHIGGGAGPRLLGNVARWADGWMPISARPSLASRLARLDEACAEVGRDRSEIDVSVFGATTDPAGLSNLFDEGIHRAVLTLPSHDRDDVLRHLDEWAALPDQL